MSDHEKIIASIRAQLKMLAHENEGLKKAIFTLNLENMKLRENAK